MPIPIVGNTSPKGIHLSEGRMINLYPEVFQGSLGMLGTPVRKELLDYAAIRAWIEHRGFLFYVSGSGVFRWTGNDSDAPVAVPMAGKGEYDPVIAAEVDIPAMNSTGFCRMASNGFDVLLTDAGRLYAISSVGNVADNVWKVFWVQDDDRPPQVSDVAFADGFFHALESNEDNWYISENSYDSESWNALDFVKSEFSPDRLKRLFRDRGMIWAMNEKSIEPYVNTGNADFPWEPVRDGVSHFGIEAPDTIARVGGALLFLGRNEQGGRQVYMLGVSADPVRVSTNNISNFLADFVSLANAYAWSVNWKGHDWYVLTIPKEDTEGSTKYPGIRDTGITLVFDLTMKVWFEWSTWAEESPTRQGRFGARDHIYFNNRHLVYDGRKIYELVDGPPHELITMRLDKNGRGFGAAADIDIGELGEYSRCIWRRLGRGRRWSFEISTTVDEADGGNPVERIRTLDTLSQDDRMITIRELFLDIEPGSPDLVIRGGSIS